MRPDLEPKDMINQLIGVVIASALIAISFNLRDILQTLQRMTP